MKPKLIPVLEMCIQNGISLGYNRAYKHLAEPSEDAIKEKIEQAIMSEIYEWFEVDNERKD